MPKPKFKGKRTKKSCREYASKRVAYHIRRGRPSGQSIAIGLDEARKEKCEKYIKRR